MAESECGIINARLRCPGCRCCLPGSRPQTLAAVRLAQQDEAAVRRDEAATEGGAPVLAADGWQIKENKAIADRTGRDTSAVRRSRRSENPRGPMATPHYVRRPQYQIRHE